jgi:hypothetical protein
MLIVGIFDCDRAKAAAGQGQGRSRKMRIFCKWRDDVIVPVICPTCQNVFKGKMFLRFGQNTHAGGKMLLCMGLFSIF